MSAYQNQDILWIREGSINNSAGNLALHIAGAVHHFIGAVLGSNGFVRDRDKEFSATSTTTGEIVLQLNNAKNVVQEVLHRTNDEDLFKEFPAKIMENTMRTDYFLVHLVSHVNYHLGQINYHRRILTNDLNDD
ncbi:DinB family protein [Pedobacter ginsengisoli]|uniref:DinB family protein n=1 Tax=Pedobacter ginsengisoli TaxID=363852 RepID=UPI00254F5FB4|nr:DinB family protein [Pedobacter ginsengisoli]